MSMPDKPSGRSKAHLLDQVPVKHFLATSFKVGLLGLFDAALQTA